MTIENNSSIIFLDIAEKEQVIGSRGNCIMYTDGGTFTIVTLNPNECATECHTKSWCMGWSYEPFPGER